MKCRKKGCNEKANDELKSAYCDEHTIITVKNPQINERYGNEAEKWV